MTGTRSYIPLSKLCELLSVGRNYFYNNPEKLRELKPIPLKNGIKTTYRIPIRNAIRIYPELGYVYKEVNG